MSNFQLHVAYLQISVVPHTITEAIIHNYTYTVVWKLVVGYWWEKHHKKFYYIISQSFGLRATPFHRSLRALGNINAHSIKIFSGGLRFALCNGESIVHICTFLSHSSVLNSDELSNSVAT